MRSKLLIGIVLLPLYLNAQTKEWAPIGAKWYYNIQNLSIYKQHGYIEYIVLKDTVILTLPAKLVLKKIVDYKGNEENENPLIVREENQRVYWFNPTSNSFSLIYDFSLKKGDTLRTSVEIYACDSVSPIIVDSITYVTVGEITLKKQYLSYTIYNSYYIGGDYTFTYEIIEKVGSEEDFLMLPSTLIGDNFAYTGLRCYIDNELTYHSHFWSTNFGNVSCDTLINTTDVKATSSSEIKIFPNPVESHFTIVSQQPLKYVEIYNSIGQKIISYPSHGQFYNTLNLTTRKSGVYFIKIFTNTAILNYKILKK
ncbi:MAG: T9SS type A sorting domain-containing protein [Bacteroidales bacterium]